MAEVERSKDLVAIVDDDESVRNAVHGVLRSVGLKTQTFTSAEDFLESGQQTETGCLITDVQMPGPMDGLKLAAAVRDRWPPIKIVATSGHVTIGHDDLPDGGRFLRKPYSPAEIMNTLREVVAQ